MRRLIKKAGLNLYHCTSAQRLLQIINDGEIGTDKYNTNGGNEGMVFLGTNLKYLTQYGSNAISSSNDKSMPDWVVILEVTVDERKLLPDMDDWRLNRFSEEEEVTWQDSLEKLEQVAYDGKIATSQIVKVLHCYEDNLDIDPNDCILYDGQYDYKGLKTDLETRFGPSTTLEEFSQKWNEMLNDVENKKQ